MYTRYNHSQILCRKKLRNLFMGYEKGTQTALTQLIGEDSAAVDLVGSNGVSVDERRNEGSS